MEFKSLDSYREGLFTFPSRNVPPEIKLTRDYAVRMMEAIYCTYAGDKAGFPYSLLSVYNEIRSYAEGRQDSSKYEKLLNPTDDKNFSNGVVTSFDGDWTKKNKREGTNNLNKEILSMAPRIMQAILGAFADVDYNLQADTIDPDSGYEQEMKKSQVYAESQHLDFLNMAKQQAGIPIDSNTKYPKDLDELQLMQDLGEFKTGIAKAIEKLLKHTYDISDWKETVRKLIRDLVCFNSICTHDVFKPEENKWYTEYEDVTRVIAQYSDKRDYFDSCFFGVIREKSVSEIRHKLEDEGYTEEQIGQLAQNWGGLLGNPLQSKWEYYFQKDQYGNWMYDFYRCLVLEAEWIDNDMEYRVIHKSKRGVTTIYDQDWGKVKNTESNQTRITTIKRKYEAKWLIGSDLVYDHQISPSQPRDSSNKRPLMSFHVYANTEKSIMQRLIPVFDNFQIAWLKLQESLIESWGEILVIDQTVLDRIQTKGETWDTLKVLKHAKKTHTLPIRSLPISGKYPGGSVKPIDIIPSTVMNRIEEATKLFENAIKLVEIVTGINPVSLGSQPSSGEGLGTTNMALQNTTKILRPIIDSIFQIKEDSAEFLSEAIRLAIRNDEDCRKAYTQVVGSNDVEALRKSNYEARQLGIKLIPRPNEEELKSLWEDIRVASMPGKDGKPLIRFDTMLYLKEKLMTGANLTDIRLYLSNSINKEIDRQEKERQAAIQAQGQQNMQLEQTKAQASAQDKELDFRGQAMLLDKKHDNELDLEELKQNGDRAKIDHERKMKEMELNQKQPANAGQEQAA
jgi:hypothetical protein